MKASNQWKKISFGKSLKMSIPLHFASYIKLIHAFNFSVNTSIKIFKKEQIYWKFNQAVQQGYECFFSQKTIMFFNCFEKNLKKFVITIGNQSVLINVFRILSQLSQNIDISNGLNLNWINLASQKPHFGVHEKPKSFEN